MAIKVTGTTVINDARELENIVDAADFVKSANFIEPPQLFIDGVSTNEVESIPTLTTSEFAIFGGGSDTHASTDWEVIRTSDSTTVFSSTGDTTNLTSIDVTPALDNGEEYLFRVRHNGTNLGASKYKEIKGVVGTTSSGGLFSTLGDPVCGGFYVGAICTSGQCYALIVAPNATGCASCQWKTNTTTDSINSEDDGYANTYPTFASSEYPAANFTATRTINGFSDWYLPSADEIYQAYQTESLGALCLSESFNCTNVSSTSKYWLSTRFYATPASYFNFENSYFSANTNTICLRSRAFRREPI